MATVNRIKGKGKERYKILFYLDGKRRGLSLGSKYTPKQIERIKTAVEDLAAAIETGGGIGKATAGFIADMTADLKARFRACGLLEDKTTTNRKLWERFQRETANRRKESTWGTFHTAEKNFFSFFPVEGNPAEITRADCENWKQFLAERGLKEATIAGTLTKATTVFHWAVEAEILEKNPFKGVKKGSYQNPERMFYIPMDWYEKLLDACPNQSWRTLIALCRIGGLRNPSETLRLTWQDVNWDKQSLLVHSPKTEIHGKGTRIIPLFPELKVELESQWELAEEGGSPYILADIVEGMGAPTNLNIQFRKIIRKAGLTPWERIFQNLRESRANELWSEYPEHVASAWLGHTKRVAFTHYLQVTDAQFQRALCGNGEPADKTEANRNQARISETPQTPVFSQQKYGYENGYTN